MARQKIESKDNARLKLARKTRDGLEPGSIFVEGLRLAEEALRSQVEIDFGLVREDFGKSERACRLIEELEKSGTQILEVINSAFDAVAETRSPQGIILICRRPATDVTCFLRRRSQNSSTLHIVLLLDEINNPSNLGAILRTAEAAGVRGVITTVGSTDAFSPASIRASMGSAFRIPIWEKAQTDNVLSWASENRYLITSTAGDAPTSYADIDWQQPRMLVFGSEAHGLNTQVANKSENLISIPMAGNVESLNIAVAAGVILFEAKRQMSAAGRLSS